MNKDNNKLNASKIENLEIKLTKLKTREVAIEKQVHDIYVKLNDALKEKEVKCICKLERATSKLENIKKKVRNLEEKIEHLKVGKKEKLNLFMVVKDFFKKKETTYYSEKESRLLEVIFQNKQRKLETILELKTKEYLDLGKKINDLDKPLVLAEDVVERKQAKILKKISKTRSDVKLEKLEKQYRDLTINQFPPKYKLLKKLQKQFYVRRLFKISKQIDSIKARIQGYNVKLIRIESLSLEKLNFFEKVLEIYRKLNYKQQKVVFGILFILPWFIGFCIFFAYPMLTTIWWSFNDMAPAQGGGFESEFVGFGNYSNLFKNVTLGGVTFPEMLTSSVIEILINLPVIIIFSLFIAVLLNKKFRGSELIKAMFFIPVVFNMSVINNTLTGVFGQVLNSDLNEGFALSGRFADFLYRIGIGTGLVEFLTEAVDRIFTIVNMSGIQILIFIAALKSIPSHLYEAAKVEGATKYEMFWKITIPMVSPMILTTVVYTVVDNFSTSDIIQFMTVNSQGTNMATNMPGLYSAISILYFLVNALIILFVFFLLKRVVFYYDD